MKKIKLNKSFIFKKYLVFFSYLVSHSVFLLCFHINIKLDNLINYNQLNT